MRTLHTVGDSHSGQLEGMNWRTIDIKDVVIAPHWLGPVTCASFGIKRQELIDLWSYVSTGDIVCFCFGEIDCRTHMYKHKDNYREVIDKIIENYFYAISTFTSDTVTTMVMSVPPISHRCHEVCLHEFPIMGTDNERREYVLYFNSQLKKYCDIYGYVYFDVYGLYCEDGYLKQELSDGYVHIKDSSLMKQKLIELI